MKQWMTVEDLNGDKLVINTNYIISINFKPNQVEIRFPEYYILYVKKFNMDEKENENTQDN